MSAVHWGHGWGTFVSFAADSAERYTLCHPCRSSPSNVPFLQRGCFLGNIRWTVMREGTTNHTC